MHAKYYFLGKLSTFRAQQKKSTDTHTISPGYVINIFKIFRKKIVCFWAAQASKHISEVLPNTWWEKPCTKAWHIRNTRGRNTQASFHRHPTIALPTLLSNQNSCSIISASPGKWQSQDTGEKSTTYWLLIVTSDQVFGTKI